MPQTDSRLVAVGAEDKALGLIIPGSAEDFLNTDRQYATLNGKKVFFQHFHDLHPQLARFSGSGYYYMYGEWRGKYQGMVHDPKFYKHLIIFPLGQREFNFGACHES